MLLVIGRAALFQNNLRHTGVKSLDEGDPPMFLQSYSSTLALSLASLTLAIVATSAHHVFRLGPELVLVTMLVFVTPLVLMALYVKTKHRALLIAYGIYVTSRKVIGLFLEQFRLQFVPVLHRLQGRLAAQG